MTIATINLSLNDDKKIGIKVDDILLKIFHQQLLL